MTESIFDKMTAEAVSKWMQPKPEPGLVQGEGHKQLSVRPEYRVGGKYRKSL